MIVDLATRHTEREDAFNQQRSSPESLIYVSRRLEFPDGPGVFELHAGSAFFHPGDASRRELPAAGVRLAAGAAIIVETDESIKVPKNMAGVVLGKGSLIFKGLIISPGKVDPGFSGNLLIAIFNGGNQAFQLAKGQSLCNCMFLQAESDSDIPMKTNPQPLQPHRPKWRVRAISWVVRNKDWLAIVISLSALIVSIFIKGSGDANGG